MVENWRNGKKKYQKMKVYMFPSGDKNQTVENMTIHIIPTTI